MRTNYHLKCINCGEAFQVEPIYKCKNCSGILIVNYSFTDNFSEKGASSLKKRFIYHDQTTDQVMNEGNTELIILNNLASSLNVKNLYGKCEYQNPTGSFKDRPVSAGIHKAKQFGYNKIIVASSGNGAASVSAASAKHNLESFILVPESTPVEKIKQTQFYGSRVIKVAGPYSQSFKLAKEISNSEDVYNLTTTFINPFTLEGNKNVAYELHDQIEKWPDYIIVPIGAGPLLVGIFKGFKEMNKLYRLNRSLPKMVGVQAKGCSPISQAYENGEKLVKSEDSPKTIAGGIGDGLVGYSEDGTFTLDIIRDSDGLCLSVSDEEILTAQRDLARKEGIFVEPSAAASVAAIQALSKVRNINDKSVLLMLTGHGLKDMNSISSGCDLVPTINPILEELRKLI